MPCHIRLLSLLYALLFSLQLLPRTRGNCLAACAAFRMDSHESNGDDDFSFDEIDESANEENILMSEIDLQNPVRSSNYSRNGAFATASFSSSSSDSDLNSSDDDVDEEEDVDQVWPFHQRPLILNALSSRPTWSPDSQLTRK